jgi:class 3 adenylate cyclase
MLEKKAYIFILICIVFFVSETVAQDQKVADSLALIYQNNTLSDSAKMQLLRDLSFNEVKDPQKGLAYAEELISLSQQLNNKKYLRIGYFLKGTKKRIMANWDEALESYFKSAEIARAQNLVRGEGETYVTIADVYSEAGNHVNAMQYYKKAIASLRQSKDSTSLAAALFNAGDEFRKSGIYDSALFYFNEAKVMYDRFGDLSNKGYCLGNIGMVYEEINQNEFAEKNLKEGIRILEALQDYSPVCAYLLSMSDVFTKKGDHQAALNYILRSLNLAEEHGFKDQIRDASLKLSEFYEKAGNTSEALKYYKNYITYRDSINNLETVQKMADLRTNYEVSQKQVEVNMLNKEKQSQRIIVIALFIILGLTIILLGTLYWFYKAISKEKTRSESLLLNILPAEAARELKQNGRVEAVRFDQVTVLFTDFVEFSKTAELVEPEVLVKSVDYYFKRFDEIATKYGIEKIKTIGDSYMCAGGLPTVNPEHVRNVVKAAREMMDLVQSRLKEQDGISHFNIRMGIHTGPVVAGVVGFKKWQYDIWGDTVNVASRMESMSKPGRINLSETTWLHIKDEFHCEYRGEIEVKNRGSLKMYFLC